MQIELREKITEGKECYRRKLERKLQQKTIRDVWSGMRTIMKKRPTRRWKETWMRSVS